MRARLPPLRRLFDIGQGRSALPGLEQGQSIFVCGLAMNDAAFARGGCLAEPVQRDIQIGRNTASKAIGLTKVELRIGIASKCRFPPFANRCFIIPRGPRIHARLYIGLGRRGDRQRCRNNHGGKSEKTMRHKSYSIGR